MSHESRTDLTQVSERSLKMIHDEGTCLLASYHCIPMQLNGMDLIVKIAH
jgi:hypothetical protein